MIDANTILQTICLAISGWVLLCVIDIKTSMAAMKQQIKDLPCKNNKKINCEKD